MDCVARRQTHRNAHEPHTRGGVVLEWPGVTSATPPRWWGKVCRKWGDRFAQHFAQKRPCPAAQMALDCAPPAPGAADAANSAAGCWVVVAFWLFLRAGSSESISSTTAASTYAAAQWNGD